MGGFGGRNVKCNYIKIPNNKNKPIVRLDYKQVLTYVGKNSRAELCLTMASFPGALDHVSTAFGDDLFLPAREILTS